MLRRLYSHADGIDPCGMAAIGESKCQTIEEVQASIGTELFAEVSMETGEIVTKHYANGVSVTKYTGRIGSYYLKAYEHTYYKQGKKFKRRIVIYIRGSLYKNFCDGHNYLPFGFNDWCQEIIWIGNKLKIAPSDLALKNLEIGRNMNLPFATQSLNDNTLLYSTSSYQPYPKDRSGVSIGLFAEFAQFTAKNYDKALQFHLADELFRFEIHHTRMQPLLKYSILNMADLMDTNKIIGLRHLLLSAWDRVLVADKELQPEMLPISPRQQQLLQNGKYADYWIDLHRDNRKAFNKARKEFRDLTKKYSATNMHDTVRQMMVESLDQPINVNGSHASNGVHSGSFGDTFTTWINCKSVPIHMDISKIIESTDPYDSIQQEPILSVSHSPTIAINHIPARLKANRFIHRLKNHSKKSKFK